jgi:hypothetical protein
MRKLENMKWWPELLRQKDSRTLRQLAETYGVSPATLSAALRRNEAGGGATTVEDDLPPEAGEELEAAAPIPEPEPHQPPAPRSPHGRAAAVEATHSSASRPSAASRANGRVLPDRAAAPVPAASAGSATAWKLILGEADAPPSLVTATSLVEAAEAAMRIRSDVLGLTYVGQIIGG